MVLLKRQNATTAFQFLYRIFRRVLPVAREELCHWTAMAERIPDSELRTQALASIRAKRFHADGGCVYAAVNLHYTKTLVRLIVALQTISDYLDNLCDRCDSYDEQDFYQLHHAMRDAVRPHTEPRDYYAYRSHADDGGYLMALVLTCQHELCNLAGYSTVQPYVEWMVERYCELQVHKHIDPSLRQERLVSWWEGFAEEFPSLHWWEFACATGSTLGMFSLFLAAAEPVSKDRASQLFKLYFPWIGGLHILLDYLIDLDEDAREGDYNFVACYNDSRYARHRISWFTKECLKRLGKWRGDRRIHRDVVRGLLGMYLSDRKVNRQAAVKKTRRLVWRFGPTAWMYFGACLVYRFVR